MNINVVASALTEQSRVDTLGKVNVSLLKKSHDQAEQHAAQLINAIAPMPEGNKGHRIDTQV